MIKETMALYSDRVFNETLNRYKVDKRTVRNLNGNESFVYGYEFQDNEYVLKISHCTRRSAEQIKGELDWLHFLAEQGVAVSRAIPSKNGHYVETISTEDSCFTAAAYERAKGNIVDRAPYDPELLRKWGQAMGRMHALAKIYEPADPVHRRLEWYENQFMNAEKWLPAAEMSVKKKFDELYNRLIVLPKGKNDYGLIHSDLHHRNFLVDNGEITVIDFDDLEYHWFINDIAKALYNEAFTFSVIPRERNTFARFFLDHFMIGYLRENELDPAWLQHFQDFLKLRHIFVYIRQFQRLDMARLDKAGKTRLTEYRASIEHDGPLLDLDMDFF
ncbi:phosphotransferase [Paenibacillus filicis]|uniref:Phosphotransferase n=1 Tax=Paenibacillus gyeongsangnamensis TaxID=3388067 RepID=A0ABT4QJA4_9BACL|nr:phosphotransferase [Paenibacillus filicis]MCZ8516968.1 phosphotransferase [Paenibacillus filicis]